MECPWKWSLTTIWDGHRSCSPTYRETAVLVLLLGFILRVHNHPGRGDLLLSRSMKELSRILTEDQVMVFRTTLWLIKIETHFVALPESTLWDQSRLFFYLADWSEFPQKKPINRPPHPPMRSQAVLLVHPHPSITCHYPHSGRCRGIWEGWFQGWCSWSWFWSSGQPSESSESGARFVFLSEFTLRVQTCPDFDQFGGFMGDSDRSTVRITFFSTSAGGSFHSTPDALDPPFPQSLHRSFATSKTSETAIFWCGLPLNFPSESAQPQARQAALDLEETTYFDRFLAEFNIKCSEDLINWVFKGLSSTNFTRNGMESISRLNLALDCVSEPNKISLTEPTHPTSKVDRRTPFRL